MNKMKEETNKTKEENKIILAIDGATKTGWALYTNGKITAHGTKQFKKETRESQYGNWLETMITKYGITNIVAEDIYRQQDRTRDKAFQVLANLQGVLNYMVQTHKVEPYYISPISVKNHMNITPPFRKLQSDEEKQRQRVLNKTRMINRVKQLGYVLENDKADDEADAIGILISYLEIYELPVKHPAR